MRHRIFPSVDCCWPTELIFGSFPCSTVLWLAECAQDHCSLPWPGCRLEPRVWSVSACPSSWRQLLTARACWRSPVAAGRRNPPARSRSRCPGWGCPRCCGRPASSPRPRWSTRPSAAGAGELESYTAECDRLSLCINWCQVLSHIVGPSCRDTGEENLNTPAWATSI